MILTYAYGHDDLVAGFVAAMIPATRERGFGRCRAIGVVRDGELIAGLVYHNWNPEAGTIELSAAAIPGQHWLTVETLKHMFQYPFLACGCQMLVQTSSADDERLLSQLGRLNYSLIRIPRLLGRDADGMVCLLTREAWETSKICRRYLHHVLVEAPPLLEEAA